LIHNSAVAMDIQCGDYAEVSNVIYEDIRVEYSRYTTPEIMEIPLGVSYSRMDKLHIPTLIKICTQPYEIVGEEFVEYNKLHEKLRKDRFPSVENVTFKNITVYLDSGVDFPNIIIDVVPPAKTGKINIKGIKTIKYR